MGPVPSRYVRSHGVAFMCVSGGFSDLDIAYGLCHLMLQLPAGCSQSNIAPRTPALLLMSDITENSRGSRTFTNLFTSCMTRITNYDYFSSRAESKRRADFAHASAYTYGTSMALSSILIASNISYMNGPIKISLSAASYSPL